MKARNACILFCLFCLSGCKSNDDTVLSTKEKYPVKFSLQLNSETLPFPETKGIPPFDMPEPALRGDDNSTTKNVCDLCCTIEYIVIDENADDPLVRHRLFTKDETDFGMVYDSLPPGNYKVALLAYGTCNTTLSGSTLQFDKVADTFYSMVNLDVVPAEEIIQDITLYRIVSKIEFVATDAVPENTKSFTIDVDDYPDRLNLFTGKGVSATENPVSFLHTFAPEEIGQEATKHSFFTFVPSEDRKLNVELTAIDHEETVLRHREVKEITPIANRIIRYTGRLYTPSPSDDTFVITIFNNGEWAGTDEKELED